MHTEKSKNYETRPPYDTSQQLLRCLLTIISSIECKFTLTRNFFKLDFYYIYIYYYYIIYIKLDRLQLVQEKSV